MHSHVLLPLLAIPVMRTRLFPPISVTRSSFLLGILELCLRRLIFLAGLCMVCDFALLLCHTLAFHYFNFVLFFTYFCVFFGFRLSYIESRYLLPVFMIIERKSVPHHCSNICQSGDT